MVPSGTSTLLLMAQLLPYTYCLLIQPICIRWVVTASIRDHPSTIHGCPGGSDTEISHHIWLRTKSIAKLGVNRCKICDFIWKIWNWFPLGSKWLKFDAPSNALITWGIPFLGLIQPIYGRLYTLNTVKSECLRYCIYHTCIYTCMYLTDSYDTQH
jgi:hypothetical protein